MKVAVVVQQQCVFAFLIIKNTGNVLLLSNNGGSFNKNVFLVTMFFFGGGQAKDALARTPLLWTGQRDQTVFFNCLGLYHKTPDSGERQCKSRTCKRRVGPALRGGLSIYSSISIYLSIYIYIYIYYICIYV